MKMALMWKRSRIVISEEAIISRMISLNADVDPGL